MPALHEFKSPIPIEGPAVNCVELVIYDNDGPEGYYQRLRFGRSADAMRALYDNLPREELERFNFTLENFWPQGR